MSKFNPKKVPKWCKWIAVDPDGGCHAYRVKPRHGVIFSEWIIFDGYSSHKFLYRGKPPKNWKDELYTWR